MTEILFLQKRVSKTEDKGLYVVGKDSKGRKYVVGPFACLEYAKNWKTRAERYGVVDRLRRAEI